MKAEIKLVHRPDLIKNPVQGRVFRILVEFLVGPEGDKGMESFDVTVCSPSWLEQQDDEIISGKDMLVMRDFSLETVKTFFARRISCFEGNSWEELASKIGKLAKWEFEDYSD